MLNTDIDEILFESGKVVGVKNAEGTAHCSMVICDPTYAIKCGLSNRVKLIEKVIRCICILDHPIPNTDNIPSVQIIIPQKQVNRKNGNCIFYFRHLRYDGFLSALCQQKRYIHCHHQHCCWNERTRKITLSRLFFDRQHQRKVYEDYWSVRTR
jgi:hypothetical protein